MGRVATRNLLVFAFFSAFFRPSSAAQSCYFPDGSESGDTPCIDEAGTEVFCCPSGSTCISSPGPICRYSNGDYVRGSCTVQDWGSSACPKFCLAINTDNPLTRCSIGNGNGNFCCGYDDDKDLCDCATNNNTFTLAKYTPIQVFVAASSTTASSSSSTAQTASSATSFSSTTTGTAAAAATTTAASATPEPSESEGMSSGAKAGLGVGIPLGLALIGGIGFFLWRRSRQDKQPQHQPVPISELPSQPMYPPHSGYAHSGYPPSGYPQPGYPAQYTDAAKDNHWYQQTPAGYTPSTDGSGTLNYGAHSPPPAQEPMHELPANNSR